MARSLITVLRNVEEDRVCGDCGVRDASAGSDHPILRPGAEGLVGHTLFYQDEIKQEYAFHADASLVSAKEMDLAEKLVGALAAKFEPEKFKDKFRERLQDAIAAKVEGGESGDVPVVSKGAPVVDIMAALQASLIAVKKPVASAAVAAGKPTAKKKSSAR